MGSLLSRFRKQPTTMEQLKKIEDSLRKIEDYKRITERKQKRTVANVIIYGAALYILACVIVFVWYLPESWLVRLGLLVPLILVPVIIYWMKRFISKYFQSKMTRANEDFLDLQRKKTEIIDNIMDTETFNKAKEILSKYAPEKLEKKLQERTTPPGPLPNKTPPTDLRKRTGSGSNSLSAPKVTQPPPRSLVTQNQISPYNKKIVSSTMSQKAPMPQPLFPRERSFSDKLVEYIVGDGPSYRYALICKSCHGHNGMALKEEFPFMSYTCCYCMTYNPARSQRPPAPRLPDLVDPPSLPSSASAPRKALDGIERIKRKDDKVPVKNDDDDDGPDPIPFDKFLEQFEDGVDETTTLNDDISDVGPDEKSVEKPKPGPSKTVVESDQLLNEKPAESDNSDLNNLSQSPGELASSPEAEEKS